MGVLSDFDLSRLAADFGCRFLIEARTGAGADIEFAGTIPFEHVYSMDRSHKLAIQTAFRNAKNQKMTIIHGNFERGLKMALEEIPAEAPVLFWMNSQPVFDETQSPSPLERELRLIASQRDTVSDIILIDDLRRYEDGDFEDGPCPSPQAAPPAWRDLGFLEDILGATHDVSRLYQRSGYLCAFPLRKQGD